VTAWACGDCGVAEDRKHGARIDWVCHHCGKLLCKSCCKAVYDGGFARSDAQPVRAVHCADCRRKYHGVWSTQS
jgi:hypothetical protein